MKGGVTIFLLPIGAAGFFVGALTAAWVPTWCALLVLVICIWYWRVLGASCIMVFFIASMCGVLRVFIQQFIPSFLLINPFVPLASATAARLHILTDAPARAFAIGLLLGGTSEFSRAWKQVFRATGTSHIVAISGSNITIVAAATNRALSALHIFPRQRTILLALLLFAFVCITGAPLSVVRAASMALFMEAARHNHRHAEGIHALAAATLLIGLLTPRALCDIGFQLSAAATLGLILAEKKTFAHVWIATLYDTIAATICTLPLSVYYFGSTSAVALVANVVVVPMVPLLMSAAGAIYLFSFLPTAVSHILIIPCESALRIALYILQWSAAAPGSLLTFSVPLWTVALWYACIAAWAIFTYTKRI